MVYFLGIDVSTTATKALLIDEAGTVVASAATEYDFATPQPLWSEQHPQLWWDGGIRSIRQLLTETNIKGADIKCIGLTGQMHGLVLLNESGEVLRPAILWNDQRTGAECDEIRRLLGRERLIQITGNDALTGFTAPKILWVRNNEPDVYRRIRQILLPKDYLRFKLTGAYATDRAGGAGTLLFNLKERNWSEEVTTALEIDSAWLPPTFEGPEITGVLSASAAEATGLAAGTPVVAGGGDQAAQATGVGAVKPGIVALTLGTSGVVFATVDEPVIEAEGRLHAFCHAVPQKWHLMGVMLSAAGSFRWYRDKFAPEVEFGSLIEQARDVPAGSEGLLFLPYLTGERTPHPDPLARAAFIGLTVRHMQQHLTRAVLEGVAFGLRDSFELMNLTGLATIDQVRISGGGARSAIWRQILADVLNTELVTVNTTEGAAYGAALLASVGAGHFDSVEEAAEAFVTITDTVLPGPARHLYAEYHTVYQSLYAALKAQFTTLGQLEARASLAG